MAKLYFSYSAMNAGKTTILLQASHNYGERGMNTLFLTAQLDNRAGQAQSPHASAYLPKLKPFSARQMLIAIITHAHAQDKLSCVLVDEAQFLTSSQVWDLARVADHMNIPVMCYGLRTDFQGNLV